MRILCAVCKREVDTVEWSYDYCNAATQVKVHCHGAVDECEVPDNWINSLFRGELEDMKGIAFATQHTSIEKPVRTLAHVRDPASQH